MKQGVFISHIDLERPIALHLQKLLRRAFGEDFPVFVSSDKRSIGGGRQWFEEILRGLRNSTVILVLLSTDSVDARWINFEAGVGVGEHGRVIPVTIRG